MSDKPVTRRDTFESTDSKVDQSQVNAAVEELAKKGRLTAEDVQKLNQKYPNNDALIDAILRENNKRFRHLQKKAQEVARKIYSKYADGSRTLTDILSKMLKYKNQNKWTDTEYDEFRKELYAVLSGDRASEVHYNQNLTTFRSRINRVLGTTMVVTEGLKIKETEHGHLNEILALLEKHIPLHRSVFMQSLMYKDCDLVAITGEYKRDRHDASSHIHPVIAALFLPKFNLLEKQMIHSSFGSIVKSRNEKKQIVTEADLLLYHDIISDPNDIVCDSNSAIADLRNRFRVQIALWETVLKLRQGKYYEGTPYSELAQHLNSCRNNLYDNAMSVFKNDEGAVLRRLMSVFSLRPTIIATKPIDSLMPLMNMIAPAGQTSVLHPLPFMNQPVLTITSIPIINFHLSSRMGVTGSVDLRQAIKQTIWLTEGKSIVPKEQSIIYSKEVLVFYVNRRLQQVNVRTQFATNVVISPLEFSYNPLLISSIEQLNDQTVDVASTILLGGDNEPYHLRSVVTVETTKIDSSNKEIITGCSAIVAQQDEEYSVFGDGKYLLYDPVGASLPVDRGTDAGGFTEYTTNKPVSYIPGHMGTNESDSFYDRASKRGTIFVYARRGFSLNEQLVL